MQTSIATTTVAPAPPDEASPAVDDGLRSAGGIRWLLWIGALVVGVSVVGLLAARWGELPPALQFLVLTTGVLALQGAGGIARDRLRLPVTAAALYFLFAALVPLLAWGAGYLRLVEEPFGWPSLVLGLGGLLWGVRRVLVRVLDHRGLVYPAALTLLVFAPAVLPFAETRFAIDAASFFLAAAVGLGLAVRFASRHVHRAFFHRDRVAGRDRPVHLLPFGLLALAYVLGLSLLEAAVAHLAVPLVFLAVALVDTGEEYYRALVAATSRVPARWPRRSVGLLAVGFGLMVVAAAASPLDAALRSAAIVTLVVAARLFAWALRYRHATAYGFALAAGLGAYHLSGALMPEAVRASFWRLVEVFGLRPGPAVIGLADLGSLAALVLLGVLLRRRATPAMQLVHVAALTFQALIISSAVLVNPAAARIVLVPAVLLIAAASYLLRRRELVPALYLAVAHCATVWSTPLLGTDRPLDQEAFLALGAVNLLFAAAALFYRRRRPDADMVDVAWLALPPLSGAAIVILAGPWFQDPTLAGIQLLSAAGTIFMTSLAVGLTAPALAAVLTGWAGTHLLAYGAGGNEITALALAGHAWLAASWWLQRRGAARPDSLPGRTRAAWALAVALGTAGGLLWLVVGVASGSPAAAVPFLGLLGLVLVDVAWSNARRAVWWVPSGTLALGVGLLALWPSAQLMAADLVETGHTTVALSLLLAAIVERAVSGVLERRGRRELANPCLPWAAALAAAAGVLSAVSTAMLGGPSWWPILPAFLASLFFVFLALEGYERIFSASAAVALFVTAFTTLFAVVRLAPEMYWLPPGVALIGLSRLLRREVGSRWSARLFAAGAGCLYAVPVMGLLEESTWGWQAALLVLAVTFGAASFRLRSRPLLILSTAAVVIDLAFFLLTLGRTAPLLLWAVGIVFGLSLMGAAMTLEYRREAVLQKIRLWGREIRSW